MQFCGRGILLDIEGTTSAVAYVYDVMFPYARRKLLAFVEAKWCDTGLSEIVDDITQEAGIGNGRAWLNSTDNPQQAFCDVVCRLMNDDAKTTGLKVLQAWIWEEGFLSGELESHVFPDVLPALVRWSDTRLDIRVYSSGAIHAQRLFFGNSEAGDLLPYFSGHYDTATGPKRESASYSKIAADWQLSASDVLFLSDVTEELDAARAAGMQTGLVVRPGNAVATPTEPPHPSIRSFDEIETG